MLAVGTDAEGREGGTVLGPDGKKYDQSLSRALLKTFAWPFWTCERRRRRSMLLRGAS